MEFRRNGILSGRTATELIVTNHPKIQTSARNQGSDYALPRTVKFARGHWLRIAAISAVLAELNIIDVFAAALLPNQDHFMLGAMSPIRSLTRALQTWVQNISSRAGSVELKPTWLNPVIPASRVAK